MIEHIGGFPTESQPPQAIAPELIVLDKPAFMVNAPGQSLHSARDRRNSPPGVKADVC